MSNNGIKFTIKKNFCLPANIFSVMFVMEITKELHLMDFSCFLKNFILFFQILKGQEIKQLE